MTVNLILDGSNIEHRNFNISRKSNVIQTNASGEQVDVLYFFLRSLKTYINKFKPDNIYVAWDKKFSPSLSNFRKDLLDDEYKAGRIKSHDISDMYLQEPKLVEILSTLGVKSIYPDRMEADDIIAWLSKYLPDTKIIVSVDQDLYQLIKEDVNIYNLNKKEIIDMNNFESIVGIKQCYFKLFKAIKGDVSDNIKGIFGFGKVKAKRLAENWTTTNVTDDIRQIVERNLKMVDLDIGYCYYPEEMDCYKKQILEQGDLKFDEKKFRALCVKYEFSEFLNNINEWKFMFNKKENSLANKINLYF